jgi:hypothetical protein
MAQFTVNAQRLVAPHFIVVHYGEVEPCGSKGRP